MAWRGRTPFRGGGGDGRLTQRVALLPLLLLRLPLRGETRSDPHRIRTAGATAAAAAPGALQMTARRARRRQDCFCCPSAGVGTRRTVRDAAAQAWIRWEGAPSRLGLLCVPILQRSREGYLRLGR
ncbi:hypothetical protein DFJ73DRAFT_847626 [Zopfochytrium polystomum]|nr:hypothetical protein DFJ73DRAFT_847626 [Zopfochytrium polystomum]